MWIMAAGPYLSGGKTQADREKNLARLNEVAYQLLKKGLAPIIGVNLGLPIIGAMGQEYFKEILMPLSLSLCERCDAIVRVGGPSSGADREVNRFEEQGKPVDTPVDQVPRSSSI